MWALRALPSSLPPSHLHEEVITWTERSRKRPCHTAQLVATEPHHLWLQGGSVCRVPCVCLVGILQV